jgi:hypothetical protein
MRLDRDSWFNPRATRVLGLRMCTTTLSCAFFLIKLAIDGDLIRRGKNGWRYLSWKDFVIISALWFRKREVKLRRSEWIGETLRKAHLLSC